MFINIMTRFHLGFLFGEKIHMDCTMCAKISHAMPCLSDLKLEQNSSLGLDQTYYFISYCMVSIAKLTFGRAEGDGQFGEESSPPYLPLAYYNRETLQTVYWSILFCGPIWIGSTMSWYTVKMIMLCRMHHWNSLLK